MVHGLSILFATLSVLLGWSAPAHQTAHRGPGPDRARTLDAPDQTADVEVAASVAISDTIPMSDTTGLDDVAALSDTNEVGELDFGQSLADSALPLLGARYVWGGASPSGFDCSGFVYYVLSQAGYRAPRDHGSQMGLGPRVGAADLLPGDLVFFQNTYTYGISHGGIYVGDGEFIHANNPGTGVVVSSLSDSYWANHWAGATRVAV